MRARPASISRQLLPAKRAEAADIWNALSAIRACPRSQCDLIPAALDQKPDNSRHRGDGQYPQDRNRDNRQ